MIAALSPFMELDAVDQPVGITREWIQSLPPELKDEALLRLLKTIEAKPTLVEVFALNQVLYRTISGGTFTESADNVAQRTGCDRKTILKGLAIAVEQNILEENKRPGTSNEYWFKPVEEWEPEPVRVVRNKDIRTQKVIEFPSSQCTQPPEDEESGVVHSRDYLETNNPEIILNDTLKVWEYVGHGNGFGDDAEVYHLGKVVPTVDVATGTALEKMASMLGHSKQTITTHALSTEAVLVEESLGLAPVEEIRNIIQLGVKCLSDTSTYAQESVPVNVAQVIGNLADTMGRTTRNKSVTKLYGKGEDKIEYFQDLDLKECGVNLNDENLISVAASANSKDFEIATECFLSWIKKQKTDDEGNIIKTDRLGNVEKINPTQKFINAINYKWKPYGYEEKVASEKLQNASAYSNTPASEVRSYFELIQEALSSDDGDFIRMATLKILPLCYENRQFFGEDFVKRCLDAARLNPKSMLVNSVHSMVKRFGHEWGVIINADGQVVAV